MGSTGFPNAPSGSYTPKTPKIHINTYKMSTKQPGRDANASQYDTKKLQRMQNYTFNINRKRQKHPQTNMKKN